MEATRTAKETEEQAPLISVRFLITLTAAVTALALLSLVISLLGDRIGERWSLAGHSASAEPVDVSIGLDRLRVPANAIRFEDQRRSGRSERLDLFVLWPEMTGYSKENRRRFDDLAHAKSLIFLQLSQSTMSRDMSGRVDPIYSHLFTGTPESGPFGLSLHRFRAGTGYDREVLLTAPRPGQADYAVRCLLPEPGDLPSNSDCQRDINAGRDLTVLYRFSSELLSDWQQIDKAIEVYIRDRIVSGPTSPNLPMRGNSATKDSL